MDYSKLSYEQISAVAGELESASVEMNSLLEEIKALFSKIGTDEVWSGDAATSTKETFDALAARFPEFYEAINDCAKYLNQVVANYQAADNAIRN